MSPTNVAETKVQHCLHAAAARIVYLGNCGCNIVWNLSANDIFRTSCSTVCSLLGLCGGKSSQFKSQTGLLSLMRFWSVCLQKDTKQCCNSTSLKGGPYSFWGQESADLYKNHQCHYVNILWCFKQLADDIIIVKLIVTSSYGEVSGPCAQLKHVDKPNSPYFARAVISQLTCVSHKK